MTMRFVFLGVIGALILIGFGMGQDGYRTTHRDRQPAPDADDSHIDGKSMTGVHVADEQDVADDTVSAR